MTTKCRLCLLSGPTLQFKKQLLGAVRNTTVFNKIADELAGKGYQREAKELKNK